MVLTRARSPEAYFDAPIGKWLAGKSFLLWAASPTLAGSIYFSRPSEDEIAVLLGFATLAGHPAFTPPFDVVVDASGIDGLSTEAFEALVGHVEFMKVYGKRVRRVGCVRPRGMVGAALAGVFYEAVRETFEAALFADRREAFTWVAHPEGAVVAAELEGVVASVHSTPTELQRLRALLAEHRGIRDLPGAARELAIAPRSLQRVLQASGTTFSAEAERTRVAAAERMLLDDDLKIEVLARRTGFASASHLARAFRKATGETPADFRRRRRTATS